MLRGQAVLARGKSLIQHARAGAVHQQSTAPGRLAALAAAGNYLRTLLSGLGSYNHGPDSTMTGRRAAGAAAVAASLGDASAEEAAAVPPVLDAAVLVAASTPPARRRPGRKPAAEAASDDGAVLAADADALASPSNSIKPKKRARLAEPSLHVQTNLRQLQPKALAIGEHLRKLYPSPPIPLDHGSPFQLLCAVLLSAQTTDKKVNEVTPALFQLAPDPAAMAALDVAAITACIRQLGLAPTKARNLQAMAAALVRDHEGAVPDSFEALEALPGVGHKTASVVMAQVHGRDAFPVDTHIHRLAQRWGLTSGKSVEQTEADLKLLYPPAAWRDLHLQIIFFGREKCPARGHSPGECPICAWAAVPPYDKPGSSPLKPGARRGASPGKPAAKKRAAEAGAPASARKRGRPRKLPADSDDDSD